MMKKIANGIVLIFIMITSNSCVTKSNDAQLALEATLRKMPLFTECIQHSSGIVRELNEISIDKISLEIEQNGNRKEDLIKLEKINKLHSLTVELLSLITNTRHEIVNVSGGYSVKVGELINPDKFRPQMSYTIGENKDGAAYELRKKLDKYVDEINLLGLSSKIPYLLLDMTQMRSFKGSQYGAVDFATLYFENTPAVVCLASLSRLEYQVTLLERDVINLIWTGEYTVIMYSYM